ncbi:hypothetical protein A2767_02495 [Candidatus Roizmanbacteria bacterium RIFCSPHIGHO2_01_FULL_35_10]|uniref:TrpR like protein, YerC/YecD n=1 Tax=Candidatus Roizmanbacteria bacterium RIFCSPLOWO2_01_FULL_35_13 TaxID=1802055 RepID=A0A1F7IB06_9BACT|nr:MAG: hypothetical protein A2767_02495 [Candidatus Roizmanbacteria bacterium RIFCSPHIGHO2_01_FULL_35_10]OGK40520.1 MAG: hypothetical protein A3A74_02925 [Candidatus Roizmanbacteria bacterium RIFCSPLOWO2_01_FULL_35_13]
MVHLSKKLISENVLMRIYQLFFEVISRSHSRETFLILLDDILTPTEKIMLAKRIGIIYLLIKEIDQLSIADILKVSTSTVSIYSVKFYKRDTKVIEIIKNMLIKEKVLDFMEDIFAGLFIQPGLKKGHHKLKLNYEQNKRDRKYLG